mmetsp:Transcript_29218/g.40365  ORF Transcript_29218/g.40365 Transcript_29218/m.40365 type:complete len:96 (+) Transcript_29218:1161-1448(+)
MKTKNSTEKTKSRRESFAIRRFQPIWQLSQLKLEKYETKQNSQKKEKKKNVWLPKFFFRSRQKQQTRKFSFRLQRKFVACNIKFSHHQLDCGIMQ